jgi:lysophospholipase L1-like esterase
MHRMIRVRVLTVVVGVLVAAAACTIPPKLRPGDPGISYMALGDSFTAGTSMPTQDGSLCGRSDHNYARLTAAELGAEEFRDVSCGGATTVSLTSSFLFEPPQLDALHTGVDVVTMGMGGNDIGFADILLSCIDFLGFQLPCTPKFTPNGVDVVHDRIVATAPKIASSIEQIHTRAPNADIYIVGYPNILADTGNGCYPAQPLLAADVPYLRGKHKELNAMLETQAQANGATYIDWYQASIGHDACQALPTRWVEGWNTVVDSFPVHPNQYGHAGATAIMSPPIESRL